MKPSTNADVVKIISSYLRPNPVELTLLAMVNKDFYSVFTSDEIWGRFDVYGRKKNIFRHFIDTLQSYEQLMVLCWCETEHDIPKLPVEKLENKYLQLGYYKKLLMTQPELEIPNKTMVKLLVEFGSFKHAPSHVRDTEAIALYACSWSKNNLLYVSHRMLNERFTCALIDETLNGGDYPLSRVGSESLATRETIEYARKVNPIVLTYWMSIKQKSCDVIEVVKGLSLSKEKLALVVAGAPQALDTFPELWEDREFCLAAFSEKGFRQAALPRKFLGQCQDREVIKRAVKNYPQTLFLVPEEFRRDVEMAMVAICSSSPCNKLKPRDWMDSSAVVAQLPWTDPEFIANIVDRGQLKLARKYSSEMLDAYLDDVSWVKARVKVQPDIWNEASMRLQKDRSLLMFALESKKEIEKIPIGQRGDARADFTINSLPIKFHDDEELLKAAACADALGNIPQNDVSEAVVKAQLVAALLYGYGPRQGQTTGPARVTPAVALPALATPAPAASAQSGVFQFTPAQSSVTTAFGAASNQSLFSGAFR